MEKTAAQDMEVTRRRRRPGKKQEHHTGKRKSGMRYECIPSKTPRYLNEDNKRVIAFY